MCLFRPSLLSDFADIILDEAFDSDVCLLVVGDPLGATTHTDLVLTARKAGIKVGIVHNASIINAVGCCGLQVCRECWNFNCL